MSEVFSNNAQTTLNGAITSGATTLVVTSATGFPTTGNFRVFIKAEGANTDEICTVTGVSGTTFTVTRASEATAGVQAGSAHASGAIIAHVLTATALALGPVADSDFTLQNTSSAYSSGNAIISRTITLRAGRYRVDALIRTSTMSNAGSPGSIFFRKDSSQITNGTYIDLRPTQDTQFNLFGFFDHTGGSTTVDVYYSWEAGTTRFGVNGTSEERFGSKLMINRIGDIP